MALKKAAASHWSAQEAAQALCVACGFCCNGTLFVDVRLRGPHEMERLQRAGIPVQRGGKTGRLNQPCPGYDGRWCRVYDLRPERCRTFACALLLELQRGRVDLPAARQTVARAQQALRDVWTALQAVGDPAPDQPLSRRLARALARPLDLSQPGASRARRRLLLATARLTQLLGRFFLTPRPHL